MRTTSLRGQWRCVWNELDAVCGEGLDHDSHELVVSVLGGEIVKDFTNVHDSDAEDGAEAALGADGSVKGRGSGDGGLRETVFDEVGHGGVCAEGLVEACGDFGCVASEGMDESADSDVVCASSEWAWLIHPDAEVLLALSGGGVMGMGGVVENVVYLCGDGCGDEGLDVVDEGVTDDCGYDEETLLYWREVWTLCDVWMLREDGDSELGHVELCEVRVSVVCVL